MTIFVICAALILSIALFLRYYPPFGQRVSREKRNEFRHLPNFDRNHFLNPIHTSMRMGTADFMSLLRDYMKRNPNRKPTSPLPIKRVDPASIQQQALTRVTWFGHSAFMLEIEGKTLLFDPMLGTSPSPSLFLGINVIAGMFLLIWTSFLPLMPSFCLMIIMIIWISAPFRS